MNKWEVVHTYRRLIRRGIIGPTACPNDPDMALTIRIGPDDEPEWFCTDCETRIRPGIDFYKQIERYK